MNIIILIAFGFLVLIISLMPFWFMYGFSDFMRLILQHLVGYRRKCINDNLKRVFSNKPDKEIKKLEKQVYRNLVDNIVEGIKAFSMRKKVIVKRHKLINPELLDNFYKNNQSVIGVTAHYNNWEWGSLSASLQTNHKVIGIYKPLSNKYIDKILRKNRSSCGTELVSIFRTSRSFEENADQASIYLMAADQSPSGGSQLRNAHWIDFLGTKTAFLHGFEKHAKNRNYPVVFIDIQRKKRGFYELELSILTENPRELAEGELTKKYANKLESLIKAEPANWLWSHKRWKHNK